MRLVGYISVEIDSQQPPQLRDICALFQAEVIEIGSQNTRYTGPKYLICTSKVGFHIDLYNEDIVTFLRYNKSIKNLVRDIDKIFNPMISIVSTDCDLSEVPSFIFTNFALSEINNAGLNLEVWHSHAMPEVSMWSNCKGAPDL